MLNGCQMITAISDDTNKTMSVEDYVNREYDCNPEDKVQQYGCTYCILGSGSSIPFPHVEVCESLEIVI